MNDYGSESDTDDLLRTSKLPEPLRLAQLLEQTMQSPLHGKAADCLRKMHAAIEAAEKQEPFGYFQYSMSMDAWVQNRDSNKGVAFYTTSPAAPVQEPNLLATLKAVQGTLIAANEQGLLADTIWFSKYETLFDFIGAEIEKAEQPAAPVQGPVVDPLHEYRKGFIAGQIDMRDRPEEQWVGLTAREIYNLWEDSGVPFVDWDSFASIARAIEQRLKEKHGGAA